MTSIGEPTGVSPRVIVSGVCHITRGLTPVDSPMAIVYSALKLARNSS
jgi:hypothetical protein